MHDCLYSSFSQPWNASTDETCTRPGGLICYTEYIQHNDNNKMKMKKKNKDNASNSINNLNNNIMTNIHNSNNNNNNDNNNNNVIMYRPRAPGGRRPRISFTCAAYGVMTPISSSCYCARCSYVYHD